MATRASRAGLTGLVWNWTDETLSDGFQRGHTDAHTQRHILWLTWVFWQWEAPNMNDTETKTSYSYRQILYPLCSRYVSLWRQLARWLLCSPSRAQGHKMWATRFTWNSDHWCWTSRNDLYRSIPYEHSSWALSINSATLSKQRSPPSSAWMEETDERVSRDGEMHREVTERSPGISVFCSEFSQPSACPLYLVTPPSSA